jgi:hypothetical protein
MIPAELHIRGQVMQQAIDGRCPISMPASRKMVPASRLRMAHPIGDPVGLSFGSAARAHPELRQELIDAGRRIASLSLGDAVLRDFLLAAGARNATAGHVEDGVRLVSSTRFRNLDVSPRRTLLRCYARLASMPESRAVLVELIRSHAIEQKLLCALALYIAGPELGAFSEPAHARTVERYWGSRAPELRRLSWVMSSAPPDEVVETYLHEPVRRLNVLQPLSGDAVIIVFGEPASPQSLSYAQRWTRSDAGSVQASLQSPDPTIAGGWAESTPLHAEEIVCHNAALTRLEELELIRWVEQTHSISRRRTYRPSAMPYAVFTGSRAIHRMIVMVAAMLSAPRGGLVFETTRMLGGRKLSA